MSEAQRSGAKWRGRGLGQRNSGFEKKLRYKTKKENSRLKKEAALLKQANNLCCAARGHALAVFNLLAPPPSLRSGFARIKNSLRPAQRQCFIIAKNLKKAIFLAKAPSHEKRVPHWTCGAFGMRGRCRPLPPLTSQGLRPRNKKMGFNQIVPLSGVFLVQISFLDFYYHNTTFTS